MVYRPDVPRQHKDGKVIKYEIPKGAFVRLDCPPRCHPRLGDPSVPLWITEGQKKADSLASRGAVVLCLLGVWNFMGTNTFGGRTLLADFDYVAWNTREVRLVFDSDVTSKRSVRQALDRLSEHLTRKGAKVGVVTLPPLNGNKCGVDDFLVAGHTLRDLEALIHALPPVPTRTPPTGTPAPDAASEDPRPVIQLTAGVDIRATVDTAQQAILALPGEPQLYQRARLLCRIARGIKPPLWLQRSLDAPIIVDANLPYLRELSQQAAQWWKYDKRAKSWDPAHPRGT
jgi:hypothetical protein